MKKILLTITILSSGSIFCANLQEKLTAKKDLINTIKQNIRAGKPIVANDACKSHACKSCNVKC